MAKSLNEIFDCGFHMEEFVFLLFFVFVFSRSQEQYVKKIFDQNFLLYFLINFACGVQSIIA